MATFNQITEVTLYPIDLDADFVTFQGAEAVKAYNGFISGRPFMATATGLSLPEVWWSPSAFVHMRVTRTPSSVDMTDNFCKEDNGISRDSDGYLVIDPDNCGACISSQDGKLVISE